jgi:hypothetical protein
MADLIGAIASLWSIPPVRWSVYAAVTLALIYVEVMRLARKREREGLRWWEWTYGAPLLLVGVVLNVVLNYTVVSLFYREWPPTGYTISQRIDHYLTVRPWSAERYPLRHRVTRRLARWLNKHDPGHVG